MKLYLQRSDQISCSVVSDSATPWITACQASLSPTPGVYSDSCPSSQWCHPAISSSVVPFSSCPQSLPASESFPMSHLFAWGGQSTGVSALASFPAKKSQDWSPLEWTGFKSFECTLAMFLTFLFSHFCWLNIAKLQLTLLALLTVIPIHTLRITSTFCYPLFSSPIFCHIDSDFKFSSSIFYENLNGDRNWKRIDTRACITEPLCWTPVMNTTWLINYILQYNIHLL